MYVWYSTCQLELEGGRRGRMCPCAAVSLSDTPSLVCVRSRHVHAIVHAWLASVPEVQGWGKQAGVALWRRGSHPLVCAVTSVEEFPPTRCKRGRQQRRTGAVSTAWVGDGSPLCANHVFFLPVLPPSFLMCVLVFNTVSLQLSNQTKVNLCSQA